MRTGFEKRMACDTRSVAENIFILVRCKENAATIWVNMGQIPAQGLIWLDLF